MSPTAPRVRWLFVQAPQVTFGDRRPGCTGPAVRQLYRSAVSRLRIVQFTPPGSPASIQFGTGLTAAAPGSAQDLMLIVDDIDEAREELLRRGVKVGDVWHGLRGIDTSARVPGRDPQGRSYGSYASFTDPDGNGWLLQEITQRLPGRQ